MTKSSNDKTFAVAAGYGPADESLRLRPDARQALSCDTEQLWQSLADRFGDNPRNRRGIASDLRQAARMVITLFRGQTDRADRAGDAFVHGCGSERHA